MSTLGKRYYERLAENPRDALIEVAQRRNLSLEELEARIANIHAAAERGEHLTLGQATTFADAPESVPVEMREHLDGCKFCQSLIGGLTPGRLTRNIERLEQEADEAIPGQPLAALLALGETLRSVAIPAIALMAGIIGTLLIIPNALLPRTLLPSLAGAHSGFAQREASHVSMILRSAEDSGGWGVGSDPVSIDHSVAAALSSQSDITGWAGGRCEVLKFSSDRSAMLCFKTPPDAATLAASLEGVRKANVDFQKRLGKAKKAQSEELRASEQKFNVDR